MRLLLVTLAVAVIAFAVARRAADRDCTRAQHDAFRGAAADTRSSGIAERAADACRGGAALAQTSGALLAAGDLDGAGRLATVAVGRDPEDARGWAALGYVLDRRGSVAAAARARAEVRRLDPLGSLSASSGRSTP